MEEPEIQEIPQGGISVEEMIQFADQVMKATQPLIPQPPSWIPSKMIQRNTYGLIEGIEYFYTPEGFIDWRKMIDVKFLVPNRGNFEKKGKQIPESIIGLDDKDLLILLGGIKALSQIRGYYSVEYSITSPSSDCVIAVCSIQWRPNFETNNESVKYSSVGDATLTNTTAFGKNFLSAIAENRAFVRAVRNFLKINIVAQDEVGPSPLSSDATPNTTSETLSKAMAEANISWDTLKAKLMSENCVGAENFQKISDIPKSVQFSLVGRLKKKLKKA